MESTIASASETDSLERGPASLPVAYQRMLERDVHERGSVDRKLVQQMIRLTAHSANYLYRSYTPTEARYRPGTRPAMELAVRDLLDSRGEESLSAHMGHIRRIVSFLSCIADAGDDVPPSKLVFGGTEEKILERKTDWCTDLARVGCVMLHVAGVPARLVNLFNTCAAYSGHQIVEAYVDGGWACVDPVHGHVFLRSDGSPASAYDMMHDRSIARRTINNTPRADSYFNLFRHVFLVNYSPLDSERYEFTESIADSYNLGVLENSYAGWPTGLKWIHGEDE